MEHSGRNLNRSKINIDDEWYTRYEDIDKYLSNFKEELKGKKIYLPCDGENSNFVKWLKDHQKEYGIKDIEHTSDDFRYVLNAVKWDEADIIITNPPFSLKTDFYKLVKKHNCDLIVLLPDTLITNKEYTNDLMSFNLYMDYTNKKFERPDGSIKQASASWFNTFKKVWTKEWKFKASNYVMTKDWVRYYNRCDNIDPTYTKDMYVPVTWIKGTNIHSYNMKMISKPVEYNNKKSFRVLRIRKKNKEEE